MLELVIILICLIINALLSCVEMAFVTVGRPQLREMARTGNRDARRVLVLRENPERTLSVIQIGITLVGALAAAIGGAGAEESLEPILRNRLGMSEGMAEVFGVILVVLPLTYLNVVMGELVPKTIALKNPLRIVIKFSRWLVLFEKGLAPIVTIFEWSTRKVIHTFFRKRKLDQTSPSMTLELDNLSQLTRQYVLNLVSMEIKRVKDIAIPWKEVVAIQSYLPVEEVENIILSSGHTRIPVLEGEEILGVLNTKEFMSWKHTGNNHWATLVRAPVQVQATDTLLKSLKLMQEKKSHLSIVYDQATVIGIVTMEDVLEEVIGDIYDEDDDGVVKKVLNTSIQLKVMRK
jgi:putative hemolysin